MDYTVRAEKGRWAEDDVFIDGEGANVENAPALSYVLWASMHPSSGK